MAAATETGTQGPDAEALVLGAGTHSNLPIGQFLEEGRNQDGINRADHIDNPLGIPYLQIQLLG